MKNKLVGILVCTLLIIATTTLVSSKENMMAPSVIDQQQPNTPELYWLDYGVPNWQQFINKGNMLEMVDVHIGCYFSGSPDITLTIKETLSGTPLTWVTYQAAALPDNYQDWFTFDVPDFKLKPNTMYYIILTFDIGSEYAWSGSSNDPYTFGMSSHPNVDWDFAFRTIVDKKPRGLNSPFLNFLENHPNMFPILRHLMKL